MMEGEVQSMKMTSRRLFVMEVWASPMTYRSAQTDRHAESKLAPVLDSACPWSQESKKPSV